MDYAQDGSLFVALAPGHSGGVAFFEEPPSGRCFHQFLRRETCCAPTCATLWKNSGSCSTTPAPVAQSEAQCSAPIFNARPLLSFVEPTAPAPATRWCGTKHGRAGGDVVVVDRNCPQSRYLQRDHHGPRRGCLLFLGGPTRNHYGIIGPIPGERVHARSPSGRKDRRETPLLTGVERGQNRSSPAPFPQP